jgi:hypothetical protein
MAESSFSSGSMSPTPAASAFAPDGHLPQRDLPGKSRRRERAANEASSPSGEEIVEKSEHVLDRLA